MRRMRHLGGRRIAMTVGPIIGGAFTLAAIANRLIRARRDRQMSAAF